MTRIAFALSLGLALVAGAGAFGAGKADTFGYRATLTARAEVPRPTAPAGAGGLLTATVTKNRSTYAITWRLTYRRLSGPAVAAHVHRGRPGVAGGVILALCGPCRSGRTGRATISKAVAEAMRRGTAYVNVHTNDGIAPPNTGPGDIPGGEIRADITE